MPILGEEDVIFFSALFLAFFPLSFPYPPLQSSFLLPFFLSYSFLPRSWRGLGVASREWWPMTSKWTSNSPLSTLFCTTVHWTPPPKGSRSVNNWQEHKVDRVGESRRGQGLITCPAMLDASDPSSSESELWAEYKTESSWSLSILGRWPTGSQDPLELPSFFSSLSDRSGLTFSIFKNVEHKYW